MRLRSVKFTVEDRHFAEYRGPYWGNANGRVLNVNGKLIDASGYGSSADITVYRDLDDDPNWLFVLSTDRKPYEMITLGAFTVEDTYTAETYPNHSMSYVEGEPNEEEFLVNQREVVVTESDYGSTHAQDLFGKRLSEVMDFRKGYAEFTIARKLKWFMDETGS